MQNITDDPILLYTMLREWFNILKPLYIMLNSAIDKGELSVNDRKNLSSLMQQAGNSCQKLIDFEEEIRYQFETLNNEVSALKNKRFELSVEVDDFELKESELISKNKLLKESVNESSEHLKNTIEKLRELNLENAELVEKIGRKKDEEYQLEQRIEDKKALLKELGSLDSIVSSLHDTQNQIEGDVAGQSNDMVSKNLFLSSRLEIMEILLSTLDDVVPKFKQVWNIVREMLECSDKEIIEDKINSIIDMIADSSKIDDTGNEPDEELKQEENIKFDEGIEQEEEIKEKVEPIKEESNVSIDSGETIDKLSKKLAFLNLECENREQKSNELLSKIELRNVALSKLEEYFEVVKNDIVLLENQYNDIKEKIKSLGIIDKSNELLQVSVSFDEKFYFEEYHKKLLLFYESEKDKVRNLISQSYEKLKNNERLLSLRQKELSIIDERAKKEFPNYELKLANLRLKLSDKDKKIELLTNSIQEYIEKENSVNLELESHKKYLDSFADEKESLLQKIIELENKNKKVTEDYNNLKIDNHNSKEDHDILQNTNDELKNDIDQLKENNDTLKELLHESQTECEDYKSKISELENKISELEQVKVSDTVPDKAEELPDSQDQLIEQVVDDTVTDIVADGQEEELDKVIIDEVIVEQDIKVSDIGIELDRLRTELSEQTQKRNNTEKALLEIEKINVSLTSQISKRDNLIKEYEEEIQNLKEKLSTPPETPL